MTPTQFYEWQGYRCAYQVENPGDAQTPPLLLIHPLGVGLSKQFWQRFCREWQQQGYGGEIYNPDLLGCGESDKPHVAYFPEDWAGQLLSLIKTIIRRPVVLVVQGATFPIAIRLAQLSGDADWIAGMVLAGPPGWPLITTGTSTLTQKVLWNGLFASPLGNGFYRYARRRSFLESFSRRQLFAQPEAIDQEWLSMLEAGSQDMATRYAVFSFLAGFWRDDYTSAIQNLHLPILVVFGKEASGIDRISRADSAQQRMDDYLNHLPQGTGAFVPGRNVLPYETPAAFVRTTGEWVNTLKRKS